MIDDKKIEEAAFDYCAYCADITNRKVDLDKDDCVDLYNGFEDGAKWAINEFLKELWHPASEKPLLQNGKCLVVYNSGKIDIFNITFVYEMLSNYGKDGMSWKCWCYISDLFPKEGDEQ